MSTTGRPGLGAAEVIKITSKLEQDDETFVIGGQATNLWAWFYRARDPALSEPLTAACRIRRGVWAAGLEGRP